MLNAVTAPSPLKKNSLLKLRKFSILPFLVKGSPSPSEPCIPTGSSPFPLLPFFALYFPFTHFIATSSIGRCYTAMTNPNQRVCNNQVNQIEIKNIFQKKYIAVFPCQLQDDDLPSCENKFRWLGITGKYVADRLDAWSAKRNCLHVSFLLLSPSYAKVENTGRWSSISGAAAPMNFLLIDSEQNVFPAAADDTGCAVCLCTGNTSKKKNKHTFFRQFLFLVYL